MLAPNDRVVEEAMIGFWDQMTDPYVFALGSFLYYACEVFSTHISEVQMAPLCFLLLGQIDCNYQTCSGKLGR